mgnify:CR=1 FL=1
MDKSSINKSHYDLLGVPKDVDALTLHKAFRILSKSLHPDTTSLPLDQAKIRFQELKEAYELLADPERRKLYDSRLNAEASLQKPLIADNFTYSTSNISPAKNVDVRRQLSGGELFSLMLLIGSLLLSLLVVIVFASFQGIEPQIWPSWLPITN